MILRLVLLLFWIFKYLGIFSSELNWKIIIVNICHVLKNTRGFFSLTKILPDTSFFNSPNDSVMEVILFLSIL